ncbi:MAG: leucyl aminopeptidase [Candidatus Gottesmanbacteria bacterium]
MKFNIKIGIFDEKKSESLVFFVWETEWPKELLDLDKKLGGILKKESDRKEFKFAVGKILKVQNVFLVGLGKISELTTFDLQLTCAKLYQKIKEEKLLSVVLDCSNFGLENIEAFVTGFLLGTYDFKKYKTDKKDDIKPLEITILVKDAKELVKVREYITRAEIYCEATIFTRNLVNEPSSVTTPTYLADMAEKLAKKDKFSSKIYDESEFGKLGLGALAGVARGSDESAKFIRLDYRNGKKKIVLAGKGITFDSGGLSLKPQEGMETMKMDMAGAASVLAIFSVIDKLRPKIHLIGLIPVTENMPSGKAIKPGDIVKAYNGKTIEVINTDAEGRLILADALSYGVEIKPDLIIDLATLTGACIVALGEEIAGLFSKDNNLIEKIKVAADTAGEKIWPMPLEKTYKELIKSSVADLKNVSGKRYGGAITAALFLEEFVGNIPWAHIDIAGPAWEEKGNDLIPRGGTGFGVRTILNFLQNL